MESYFEDAVELVHAADATARLLVTCEHASERLPAPWEWPVGDRWLVGTHWAYDIGASDLARELASALGCGAVLSRFSRLLADPNRSQQAPALFLRHAEGREIALNRDLDDAERERRLERLWRPYHRAIDRQLERSSAPIVLAIHTFTPVYDGVPRETEIGVLFDEDEALAERARAELAATGLRVRMNEPYSGRQGLIYSARRHALAHRRQALELEVRQDLAVEAVVRTRVIDALRRLG